MKHALAVQHTKKNEQIGYLEYSLLIMTKISYISKHFRHFSFFESQNDQGVTQLVIRPFCISKTLKTVSLRNSRFFQSLFYFSCIFSKTIPYINSETNTHLPIFNVVCKYLIQFCGTSQQCEMDSFRTVNKQNLKNLYHETFLVNFNLF